MNLFRLIKILLTSGLLTIFMILSTSSSYAQNTVKGKVEYSAIKKKITINRGSNYRNKGKSKKESNDGSSSSPTKAVNSIVSLVPLDAEIVLTKNQVSLRQKEKTFEPHVLAITKGSSVTFTNEDNFFHNVFSLTRGSRFNIGRKKPGVDVTKTFTKSGIIKVFCDIHPQMSAYILCLDTPYFSNVDKNGNYTISNLPDGKYKLQFFNPEIKIEDQIMELKNGVIVEKNFIISPDNSSANIEYDRRWYAGACCNGTMCAHTDSE